MDPSCGFFPVNVKWTSTLKTNCCFFKMPFQKNKVQINTSSPAYVFFTKTVRQICNMQQIYRRLPMQKWFRTSARVFSYKFATYLQNASFEENLRKTASEITVRLDYQDLSKMAHQMFVFTFYSSKLMKQMCLEQGEFLF